MNHVKNISEYLRDYSKLQNVITYPRNIFIMDTVLAWLGSCSGIGSFDNKIIMSAAQKTLDTADAYLSPRIGDGWCEKVGQLTIAQDFIGIELFVSTKVKRSDYDLINNVLN